RRKHGCKDLSPVRCHCTHRLSHRDADTQAKRVYVKEPVNPSRDREGALELLPATVAACSCGRTLPHGRGSDWGATSIAQAARIPLALRQEIDVSSPVEVKREPAHGSRPAIPH